VTEAYGGDLPRVIQVLNEALATEIVCVLRYKRHYYTASGIHAGTVAAEFLEHAAEEQQHADLLAERIVQLGGEPDFNPDTLSTRSHAEYDASADLIEMIKEDLIAERVAIASYTEIVQWLGHGDPTTRRVFEQLLAQEEEHADDLRSLLERLPAELRK
jgi:bacterioferritin